ncbi:MAG: hypothetical protein VYD53_10450 [Pseudomonadota bacterium]|nr:hypothetical protein [Pseudomonadota bacterium]
MRELTFSETQTISGAGEVSNYLEDLAHDVGYAIGYAAGYIYNNILIGNGVVDDIASATVGQ